MPTYDYVCQSCGHEFEARQSIKESPLETCPSCEVPSLKRKIGTGAGIIFKGSGFYETDYKRPAGKSDDGGAASGGEGAQTAGTKSESSSGSGEAKSPKAGETQTATKSKPE